MRRPPPIEQRETSLGTAWDDFARGIEVARALSERGAKTVVIDESMRYVRQLLTVVEREIANSRSVTASGARETLAGLRDRLRSLENNLMRRHGTDRQTRAAEHTPR
jgi:hypothetical protein